MLYQREPLLVLVADDPSAAVDLEEDRAVRRVVLAAVHIQPVAPAIRPVAQVLDALDLRQLHPERHEEAGPGKGWGVTGGQVRVDALDVVLAQPLLQRSFRDLTGTTGEGDQVQRPRDRANHQEDGNRPL